MNIGILNKKSLGPFRPVKTRGPGFSGPARLGPRAGPRFTISTHDQKSGYGSGLHCWNLLKLLTLCQRSLSKDYQAIIIVAITTF